MKKYFENRAAVTKISVIMIVLTFIVAYSYYFWSNQGVTEKALVMSVVYLCVAISALITFLHGLVSKRSDMVLISVQFLILGVIGTTAEVFHALNKFRPTSHFIIYHIVCKYIAYALSTIFIFSFVDKVAFGKRLLAKWWFVLLMTVFCVGPTAMLYFSPDSNETLKLMFVSTFNIQLNSALITDVITIVYGVISMCALVLGVFCLIRKKDSFFSWTYTIYAFSLTVTYAFQYFRIPRYDMWLLLAMATIPWLLTAAVRCTQENNLIKNKK